METQTIKSEVITESLANAILARCFRDDESGRLQIALENCRLNFSKTYFMNGFTHKTIKLSWKNGDNEIHVQGKVEQRNDYYAFYAEGWNFIEHINLSEIKEVR